MFPISRIVSCDLSVSPGLGGLIFHPMSSLLVKVPDLCVDDYSTYGAPAVCQALSQHFTCTKGLFPPAL